MTPREIFEQWWSQNQHAAGVWQHDILLDFIDTLIDDERITAAVFQQWLDSLYDDRAIGTYLVYGAHGVGKSTYGRGRTIREDELTGDWEPEVVSGHQGMRNRKTGEWRYYEG